ncbi:hypothetical protein AX17_006910, partial [Amanita inopinata Kibby_2008]
MSSPPANTTGLTNASLVLHLQQTVTDCMGYISHVCMHALIDRPPNTTTPIPEELAHIADM